MKCYEVTFRLDSPLHAGSPPLGFIQRTRPYLPARTVWGALTAAWTRRRFAAGASADDYVREGKNLAKAVYMTHFFPRLASGECFVPDYGGDQGLHYDSLSAREFERRFIGSRARTAIDSDRLGAEVGSLHETEFLSHRDLGEKGGARPVYLRGYAFVEKLPEDASDAAELFAALDGAQVGGERKYGFGLLRAPVVECSSGAPGLFEWDGARVTIDAGKPFLFHAPLSRDLRDVRGDLEPLVWRETNLAGGFGQAVVTANDAKMFWTPGSVPETPKSLVPGSFGIFLPPSP